MIQHALQGGHQIGLPHPRRQPQQHRLVEAIERTALLRQPAHDRRRRQGPDRTSATTSVLSGTPSATAASAATV